mmetsp:Transcript_32320/g.55200  ORF Transcript_32320/g.55200 Transcript_32320/m.55200 type:complete len:95 (+) Transcript_32320:88-372(+)
MDSTEPTFPICDLFHDRFVSCLRPTRQATHIYKHSVAENCGIFVDDWRLCMKAKLEKDDDKIKAMYKETHHYKNSLEVGNDIFKYKKTPGWETE